MVSKRTLCEVKEILKYLEPKLLSKIPEKLINKIQNYNSSEYSFQIDKTKELQNQDITKETKEFISAIYLEFCCSPEEKERLINICKENDIKQFSYKTYEELFQKREKETTNNMQLMVIEEKQTWYLKIWKKIKSFFKIGK